MGSTKCPEPPAGSNRACKLGFPGYILSIFSSGEGKEEATSQNCGERGGQAWQALQSFPEREPCKAPGMKRLLESGLPGFRVERMLLVQFQQSVIPCNFTSRGDNQACEIHHPRPL